MANTPGGQLYCSVDLEFTGFDPARDQILEIGFAFFSLTERGAEITEQWSQVFKPSVEVHPKILGLTGITIGELQAAPEFNEHREFLQSKLGNAIIVGHNPVMDVKFLEGYGIKLSGKTFDTLELVQFLLPTRHSYNLENLMHYFGISHKNAHRALGDAISTIALLEHMVRIYQSFNDTLQKELSKLMQRGDFIWQELLNTPMQLGGGEGNDSLISAPPLQMQPFEMSGNVVTIDPKTSGHEFRLALGLSKNSPQTVMVVEDSSMVLRLWKEGFVEGVFGPEDSFDENAFEAFKQRASTSEEIRFCLKIVVWLHVNWQRTCVLDLNISFFGGQFRQFIVGGKANSIAGGLVCCDYKTYQLYAAERLWQNREVVIVNLQAFEKFVSSGNATHSSWNSMLYVLRLIYNPENDYGNEAAKPVVLNALGGVDLFFALVYMLLHREYPQLRHVALHRVESEHSYIYNKISKAAAHLKEKLWSVYEIHESKDLLKAINFLDDFFKNLEGGQNRIKWITLDEHNLSFHDQPVDIIDIAQSLLKESQSYMFTDTIFTQPLLFYYAERLGLNTEVLAISNISSNNILDSIVYQKDVIDEGSLVKHLMDVELPAVVIMPDVMAIKSFYNKNYATLKERAAVFAQGYSGGGNKMFRNFSIKSNSILLATSEFIAKQKYVLNPHTVIFTGLPAIGIDHPYVQALITYWSEKFPNLHKLLVTSRIVEALKKLSGADDVKVQTVYFKLEL